MTSQKWTTSDIPDQRGRTAVITGSNTGIGFEAAKVLAARGASVVLAVRNLEKGKEAAARVAAATPGADVTIQQLDLSSLESVRTAATELRANRKAIDMLINNAGVSQATRGTTADGFELQFGTNHLGHFALTGLLLDRLLAVPGSRVVTVSSLTHKLPGAKIDFDDLQSERSYNTLGAYGRSKLANLLFTYELQRRLTTRDTSALAAHPGGSRTNLGHSLPGVLGAINNAVSSVVMQSAEMGALPTLRAATDPTALGGQYYGPGGLGETRGYPKVVRSSGQSHDAETQRRLWTVSEELTGVTFPV